MISASLVAVDAPHGLEAFRAVFITPFAGASPMNGCERRSARSPLGNPP